MQYIRSAGVSSDTEGLAASFLDGSESIPRAEKKMPDPWPPSSVDKIYFSYARDTILPKFQLPQTVSSQCMGLPSKILCTNSAAKKRSFPLLSLVLNCRTLSPRSSTKTSPFARLEGSGVTWRTAMCGLVGGIVAIWYKLHRFLGGGADTW